MAENNIDRLRHAEVVVAGGYGVGSKEDFRLLYQLAEVLGGEVGATRAATDAGFCDPSLMIGSTGITVRPRLYIACGISGARQHTAGVKDCPEIISVNPDPEARMNQIANKVYLGTVREVLPALIEQYRQGNECSAMPLAEQQQSEHEDVKSKANENKKMSNFYTDTPEIRFEIEQNELMQRIVQLRENDFAESGKFDDAPGCCSDAIVGYNAVLGTVGDVAANVIAPNAAEVDKEGPHLENGRVRYAARTYENLAATIKAGMNGMTMPRRFGGKNLPSTVYTAANELVARADAGFETVWSLQNCIETLYEFGSEDQHQRFIPRICKGETMSMDLTEPDAGSDLQSVMLRATYDEANDCWRLNGTKRFITNGDSDLHLVLARSEEGTHDGRGLSMFIYDKKDGGVDVRRIENKLGIKGSPTCELIFRNARAELCGSRKFGLIKYVMALMNGARLGIAAQSVGISQAAYECARKYAGERYQFGQPIAQFPAVDDLLSGIKAKLDAGRSLLYQTARYVDIYKALDNIARERKLTPEERTEYKTYSRLADAFTPLAKGINSEYANQNAYDAVQVHGGSGYMLEYQCQRLYRDARITSIYEGTTQMQVVAATRYITGGVYSQVMNDYAQLSFEAQFTAQHERILSMISTYDECIECVKQTGSQELTDHCSRNLYEMTADIIMSLLLLRNASKAPELFTESFCNYVIHAESDLLRNANIVSRRVEKSNTINN